MKKNNIDLALAVAAVWLSVSLAVIAGIYFTRDMRCLWFLLIAACVRIGIKGEGNGSMDSDN